MRVTTEQSYHPNMAQNITKKLLNNIDTCVDENIEGFLRVHQGLCQLKGHRVILRKDIEKVKEQGLVTTLTGGGSGHEPAFAGYVGKGMMCAAVHGSIFASPSPTPILATLRILGKNHPAGVIMVYNNYTGDRLNFGVALERAKAEGIKVGMLVNRCDCALLEGRDRSAGRRGLTGITLLTKIVGSMADEGKSFDEIMKIGSSIIDMVGTLGVCLSPCSLPGRAPSFTVAPDEMEIGLGLHGEAGVKTSKIMNAHDCVAAMLEHMSAPSNKNHIAVRAGDHIAVALNNLGSTTEIEMNILVKETIEQLERRKVHVDRAYVNRFATSLEMAGFGITILHLNDEIKYFLDSPTKATVWVSPFLDENQLDRKPGGINFYEIEESGLQTANFSLTGPVVDKATTELLHLAIKGACLSLVESQFILNKLDTESGDGDCGTTMKTGAEAILKAMEKKELPFSHPNSLLLKLGNIMEDKMGGSSGALYSLLFISAASAFVGKADFQTMVKSLECGIKVMSSYGGAQPGDRTMLDPLHDASTVLLAAKEQTPMLPTLEAAVQAAEDSAKATVNMQAGAGRASYVNQDHLTQPDPGATGVALWMRAALNAVKDQLKMN